MSKKLGFTFYYNDWLLDDQLFNMNPITESIFFHIIASCTLQSNRTPDTFFEKLVANRGLTRRTLNKHIDILINKGLIEVNDGYISAPSVAKRLKLSKAGSKAGKVSAAKRRQQSFNESFNGSLNTPSNESFKKRERERERETHAPTRERDRPDGLVVFFVETYPKLPVDIDRFKRQLQDINPTEELMIKTHLPQYVDKTPAQFLAKPEDYIERRLFEKADIQKKRQKLKLDKDGNLKAE
jgi:hypothetical protein